MDEKEIDWQQPRSTWSKLSKKERRKLSKEQKKQRQEAQKRQGNIGKWVFIGVVIVLITLGGLWFFKEASKPLPGTEVADQGRDHVSRSEWEKFKYNSNPPTSGPHDAVSTKSGVYTKPQGDGHLIHSLEHGYVIISHNCEIITRNSELGTQNSGTESAEMDETDKDCLGFVNELKERVEKDSWKLILVPRPNLDTNFALTAWTRIDKFNTEDANMDRVETFIKMLRNNGPEKTT